MTDNLETRVKAWGIGWLIALVVLLLCVVFWAIGKAPEGIVLLLIGLLALARLL